MPEQYDDFSLPIKFDIAKNDEILSHMLLASHTVKWYCAIDEFYSTHFETLDALMFSAEPQKFSFGGNLISDKFNSEGDK